MEDSVKESARVMKEQDPAVQFLFDWGEILVKNRPVPPVEEHFIDLPSTRLHYLKTGSGPPLIIVPALVSKMCQWQPMAQFMGQKFTAYFFELPGYGESSPYPEKFQTHFVPKTVEALVDELGIDRFTLMGLSFGGLLALRTLDHLLHRIDRVVILCPALSRHALTVSSRKQFLMKLLFGLLRYETMQKGTINLLTGDRTFNPIASGISRFSTIDRNILVEKELKSLPQTTLDVFTEQLNELLRLEYDSPNAPFTLPCFFGMSRYDNLLDYETTLEIMKGLFTDIHIETFTMPYHQPPTPYTFDDYNAKFGQLLESIHF